MLDRLIIRALLSSLLGSRLNYKCFIITVPLSKKGGKEWSLRSLLKSEKEKLLSHCSCRPFRQKGSDSQRYSVQSQCLHCDERLRSAWTSPNCCFFLTSLSHCGNRKPPNWTSRSIIPLTLWCSAFACCIFHNENVWVEAQEPLAVGRRLVSGSPRQNLFLKQKYLCNLNSSSHLWGVRAL